MGLFTPVTNGNMIYAGFMTDGISSLAGANQLNILSRELAKENAGAILEIKEIVTFCSIIFKK